MKRVLLILVLFHSFVFSAEVICKTVQSSIKKIQCKYMALAQTTPRQVTFIWTSPDNEADNRKKVLLIPSGHVSVYDYRYFAGRSEGKWKITVNDDTNSESVSTEYIKDSNAEVIPETSDPILKGR